MLTFFTFSSPAPLLASPKTEPPTIIPQTKCPVSQVSVPVNKRPHSPEAKVVPPEPKKRTNRKASITNLEKEEPLLELKQSMLSKNNEDQKNIQSVKNKQKDFDAVPNGIQLERHKEKDSEEHPVMLVEKDGRTNRTVEEPQRPFGTEGNIFVEKREAGRHLEDKAVFKVSQSGRMPDDTVAEQKKHTKICVEKEREVEQSSCEPQRPPEKTSDDEKKVKDPGTVLWINSEEVKLIEKFIGKETVNEQDVKSVRKKDAVDKTEKEPFKPPVRSKGMSTAGKAPLKYITKETEEIVPQLKPSGSHSGEDQKQKDQVKQQVSREAESEKTPPEQAPSKNDLNKPSQPEKPLKNKIQFVPPEPPLRTKSKPKGGTEKQFSRDTETDQDDQELTTVVVKTVADLPMKLQKIPVEKEVDEKPVFEKTQSITSDTEVEARLKQSGKTTEKDAKQPIKQPVKPMRKEPEGAAKQADKVVNREEAQPSVRMIEDVPLLYISEDDTFSEALTEIPVNRNIQPVDSSVKESTQLSCLPLQRTQPSKDAPPDFEINTEDEPQMHEAAVKIQAAFKAYKTRKDMRPVFKEVFKNQNADLHGTVTLVCVVEGKPSTVRWLRNSQQIISDKRCCVERTEKGVCTLVIHNLTTSDSGVYTCEVVNKFGVTSYNGNVTVVQHQQPPLVAKKPVHPPLAAITPLQLATQKLETQADSSAQNLPQGQTQVPTLTTDGVNYVESVSISLWEAYNMTEQDTTVSPQERRGSSLIAASSSELCSYILGVRTKSVNIPTWFSAFNSVQSL